jgi:hypothetical protein
MLVPLKVTFWTQFSQRKAAATNAVFWFLVGPQASLHDPEVNERSFSPVNFY